MATSKKTATRTTAAPAAAPVLEIPTEAYICVAPILYDGGTKRGEPGEEVQLTEQEAESLGQRVKPKPADPAA